MECWVVAKESGRSSLDYNDPITSGRLVAIDQSCGSAILLLDLLDCLRSIDFSGGSILAVFHHGAAHIEILPCVRPIDMGMVIWFLAKYRRIYKDPIILSFVDI